MIGPGEVERFRAIIAAELGLAFDDSKLGQLGDLLQRRLDALELAPAAYLARLGAIELATLAPELTVPETYFFRNSAQFRALAEIALRDRIQARDEIRSLRLLSAGCATGEEPYSLAIAARGVVPDATWRVAIRAVDVNPVVLARARAGRYTTWALRETSPEVQQRWFRADGRDLVLDDSIRAAVDFEQRNLALDTPELWQPGAYDVIFCRNVIMYFTPAIQQAVVERIEQALAPGGYLFLGHAETLRGLSQRFHLCHTHETFYYQRRHGAPSPRTVVEHVSRAAPELAQPVDSADTWIETVRRAAERVQALTDETVSRTNEAVTRTSSGAGAQRARDLGGALELLGREHYSEALDALPADGHDDPDVLLLRAVLLVHSGRLGDAEDACTRLLAVDELSAGARYLLALCREGAGDVAGAIDHDRVAIYLDPSFAMPRLHLGVMARRSRDHETAQRELGHAMLLLQREDASRLLLFGGGFQRDALIALCKAELGAVR